LARQREEAKKIKEKQRVCINESKTRSSNVSIASLVKEAVDVSHMEIKTSKLLNVIEHEKYVHL